MSKFLTNGIQIKACPKCNHWFGIDTKKRFDGAKRLWYFQIVCKSCTLETKEFQILDEAKLAWNEIKF
ncbi:hypothetical protein A1343_15835 [Leptospira interrogans serovar Bataviae]|nr:hypothetical protein [Leptospira interrogans serovar Bataviae]OAM86103.1 hypothetical protein A1343_15835 [Leptospira interrogans serovar Bataviae]QOI40461.1 hypothetical protein Lepto1548_19635 [Leptospira interrogans serovar Bataviae]